MNILITGSNRGIGLGLVRAYISKGAYVIATCRTLENIEELETLRNSPAIGSKFCNWTLKNINNLCRWMKNLVI